VLGLVSELSRKDAMAARARTLEIVNQGRVIIQSQVPFKALVERFLTIRVPQLGVATQNKYQAQINNHILPAFGEMRLCEIDRAAVEQFLIAKKDVLGWWSLVDLKGVLSAIFSAAKDWKLWPGENPTQGMRIPIKKKQVREKRILPADDFNRLLAMLDGQVRLIVLLLFGTRFRISEVLGLRWRNIDIASEKVTVERRWYRGDLDEPKTDASNRTRPLGPMAVELAAIYPGPQARDQFVFVGDDGNMPPDERDLLRFGLRPVLKKLGLYYQGFGWHAFRRLHLTLLQSKGGATPFEAMKAAGHTRLATTFDYTLTDEARQREQVYRLFEKVIGTTGGRTQ
jgi:integrase